MTNYTVWNLIAQNRVEYLLAERLSDAKNDDVLGRLV